MGFSIWLFSKQAKYTDKGINPTCLYRNKELVVTRFWMQKAQGKINMLMNSRKAINDLDI